MGVVNAAPFLFAPGYVLDYQLVVCPHKLSSGPVAAAFRRFVASLAREVIASPKVVSSTDPLLERWVFVYSCRMGQVDGAPARDVANRPVEIVWGLVAEAPKVRTSDFDSSAIRMLEDKERELQAHLDNFWHRRKPPERPITVEAPQSPPVSMPGPTPTPSQPSPSPAPQLRPQPLTHRHSPLQPILIPRARLRILPLALGALLTVSVGINALLIAQVEPRLRYHITLLTEQNAQLTKENEDLRKMWVR